LHQRQQCWRFASVFSLVTAGCMSCRVFQGQRADGRME
jgi:hypothetical protein